jgi:hypothetical protein
LPLRLLSIIAFSGFFGGFFCWGLLDVLRFLRTREEGVIFRIGRASDHAEKKQPCANAVRDGDEWVVELHSLDDLLALIAETKRELIVGHEPSIIIYDDYVE